VTGRLRAVRWPLLALAVAVALLVVAFALDAGPATARDIALMIGATALYIVLPLGVVWLVIAMVMHGRDRHR
jgi:hypothetical protein